MPEGKPLPREVRASRTGPAEAEHGSVAVSGSVFGDISLHTGSPVRTRYKEQVLRIAPPELLGRERELAQLAAFCTAPTPAPSYSWWKGEPWAGKSALMAWFVLHPPENVRIVSFFVTARFASQNDRGAFIENVLEQLATLLGEPLSACLTDSTRDAHLLGLLSDAARVCSERHERLVLVVDGLDEDYGVSAEPGSYSIAALLPASPPADMRIIVSARRNSPIPPDVPRYHPLRAEAIIQELTRSPYAEVVQNDLDNELLRLLHGSQAQRSLLGLLTAAQGGLSGPDLTELAGQPARQIGRELKTATGRTLQAWPSAWRPGTLPDVYTLGHETLQEAASEFLGAEQIRAYQDQLHAWADRWQERGWPDESPEYLLRGYYRLLQATGNLERMIACTTDRHRQDAMMRTSGSDRAAIEEISIALAVCAGSAEPDLAIMARLAIVRDYLAGRNAMIPVELPAALAALGDIERAQMLARSSISQNHYARSLVELVRALTASGHFRDAENIARSIADTGRRAEAVNLVLNALGRKGDSETATTLLPLIVPPGEQVKGFTAAAEAAARAGKTAQALGFIAQAEAGLPSITQPRRRGEALAVLAHAAALTGDSGKARLLVGEAEDTAQTIGEAGGQTSVLTAVVRAVSEIDGRASASHSLDRAVATARSISSPESRVRALTKLVRAAIAIDEASRAQNLADEAERLIRVIERPARQAGAWAALLRAAAPVKSERTPQLLREAEEAARSVSDVAHRAAALAVLSRTAKMVAEVDIAQRLTSEAEHLTRSVVDPEQQARRLACLAKAAAAAGKLEQAEQIAQSITSSRYQAEALTTVARAVAASGNLAHAKGIAQSAGDLDQQSGILAALAKDAARSLNIDRSEDIVASITSVAQKEEALVELAVAYCQTGDPGRAGEIAASVKRIRPRVLAYSALAERAVATGAEEHAVLFARQAEAAAQAASGRDRATLLAAAARGTAATRDIDRARAIALSIDGPGQRGAALAAVSNVVASAGDIPGATSIAVDIADRYWSALAQLAVAEALTASGDHAGAQVLIASARSVLGQVPHQNQRDAILMRLVRLTALTEGVQAAEKIVPEITSRARQADALIDLARMGDAAQAPTLIAESVQLDQWTTWLTELVRARPDAWPMILAEVTSSPGGENRRADAASV